MYSLVDNRLSAHLLRSGGLLLPAGSAGFAKYLRFGNTMHSTKKQWELRQTQGAVKVAHINGSTGKVVVPVTGSDVNATTLRVRAFNDQSSARELSARINDNKDITASMAPGWSTVELTIPSGQLKTGENEVLFFLGGGAGLDVAWMQLGGTAPTTDDASTTAFYGKADKSLLLPQGGGLAYFVAIPDKAVLSGDLSDGACSVDVTATAEDGKTAKGKLEGTGSAVDLSSLAGKAARVTLVANGCATARLANASLAIAGDAPKVARGAAPKYVVFVIMDSLRADRVKLFNSKARPETPTWTKLAADSAVFEQDYVQGNESQVSHASIWTSDYPIKHGKLGDKDKLDSKWHTIDEVAKAAGLYTAGVSANGYIRPKKGFGDGWDKFSNHIEEELGLKGEDVLTKGLSFVEGKKQPWFLYMGMIDTHVTWRPKEPWMSKYDGGYKGRFEKGYGDDGALKGSGKDMTDREKEHVRALYDSNVSYQDDLLRQLIEKLQAWGIYDQTMIIVTADHGDEQWEEGRVGHGGSNRDMLIHVPLIIHYPPLFPAGKITEGTDSVDITPTVADALGQPMDADWQGESLIPLAQGTERGYPRMSFNSMYEDFHAGRMGHWKVRVAGGTQPKVFNLSDGEAEHDDLGGTAAAEIPARMILDPLWMMRQWNLEWKKYKWGNAANVTAAFASDMGE